MQYKFADCKQIFQEPIDCNSSITSEKFFIRAMDSPAAEDE